LIDHELRKTRSAPSPFGMAKRFPYWAMVLFLFCFPLNAQDNWFMAQTDSIDIQWISASSELVEAQYAGNYIYPPVNMLDGDFSTTWSEAEEGGSGIGETITLQFRGPVSFDEIQLVNGFAYGNDYYHKNNRVARITLTQIAGEHYQNKQYTLQDDMEDWQSINFQYTQTAETVIIQIDEVYGGYKYDDTCINDIQFLYQGQVIPFNNVEEIKEIQQESSRMMLESSKEEFQEAFFALFQGSDSLYLRAVDYDNSGYRIDRDPLNLVEIQFIPRQNSQYALKENNYYSDQWFELQNFKIIEHSSIDYIETQRTMIIKLDVSSGIYINGEYYQRIDQREIVD
jgi:hypothetical protein